MSDVIHNLKSYNNQHATIPYVLQILVNMFHMYISDTLLTTFKILQLQPHCEFSVLWMHCIKFSTIVFIYLDEHTLVSNKIN